MDQAIATEVLSRFDNCIKTVARNVAETFPSVTTAEDAAQDASILVLSYAGLVPGGRHAGKLVDIERETGGNETRIKNILSTQLRLDLSQDYGRELEKQPMTVPLEMVHENIIPPRFDLNESLRAEEGFRKRYPTLALWLVDDMTEEQIAEMAGVTTRTVERRIAKEKCEYLTRYARRGGLRVVGDESLAELQEACAHLRAAGR